MLWRHHGHVDQPYARPFEQGAPLLICLDDLPYDYDLDDLDALLSDLSENGLSFVLLGTARLHEWQNSPLPSKLGRLVTVQEFPLQRLDEAEARALLDRLEANNALGALERMSPAARLNYLLDRLQADGQLLPALMTARAGNPFQEILKSVFTRLQDCYGQERAGFLLRGYAGIALVHRFGFWMSRRLLAKFLPCPEADLTPRLLYPLRGELVEITEGEAGRLYTRHPWIAERALSLLAGPHLPEERYLYQDLFTALGETLSATPYAAERKLTTMLPLAFKYQGNIPEARRLFQLASQADPKNAPVWQAWALMEKELGNIPEARRLFQLASQADPKDAPVWQAWALMEAQDGHPETAEVLLRKALEQVQEPCGRALLLSTLGGLRARQKQYPQAEEAFRQALELDEKNPFTHYHFAVDCLIPQRRIKEACQHLHRAQALRPRKERDRHKIEAALHRYCPDTSVNRSRMKPHKPSFSTPAATLTPSPN